jgi:hypothetical protein
MGRQPNRYEARAALNRDLIWMFLWELKQPGWPHEGWVTPRLVYDYWREGRDECGIIFEFDWIGSPNYFSYVIKRLVADGRAERRKLPGRHPTYRAVDPALDPLSLDGVHGGLATTETEA